MGLLEVYASAIPNDLLHLSKKKQKLELRKRFFAQKKLDNPNFTMSAWRKEIRQAKEQRNCTVQKKKTSRRKDEKVDRFMYNEQKHGKMPMSGCAIVSLKNAAESTMRYPSGDQDSLFSTASFVSSSCAASSSSASSSASSSSFVDHQREPVRTSRGQLRSLSSIVLQEIANAYSNPEANVLFHQTLIDAIEGPGRNNRNTYSEDINGKNVNEEAEMGDSMKYHQLHRKRTKLRNQVKSLIQKNNKDSYYNDVVLYDVNEDANDTDNDAKETDTINGDP